MRWREVNVLGGEVVKDCVDFSGDGHQVWWLSKGCIDGVGLSGR